MEVLKIYRTFVCKLFNSYMGKRYPVNNCGIQFGEQTLLYCPEKINFTPFFDNSIKQIFLVKEIFREIISYKDCPFYKKIKLIKFSELFELELQDVNFEELVRPNDCVLLECSFMPFINNIYKQYSHQNRKFNAVCPDSKNVVIIEQLEKAGLKCSIKPEIIINYIKNKIP